MSKVEIKVDNTNVVKNLLNQTMEKTLTMLGMQGERNAKIEITRAVYDTPESPNYRRTGNLRNSITWTSDRSAAYIGTDVEYAPYVELGTSKMKKRPFLKPAVTEHMDEYRAIVKQNFDNA